MSAIMIVNTSHEEIQLPNRTYQLGSVIPSRGKAQYSTKVIEDRTDYEIHFIEYDYTKAKKIPVPVPAETICADFFATERLADKGCFMKPCTIQVDGNNRRILMDEITPLEIQNAHARRKAWLTTLVEAGDDEYLRTKKVDNIPTMCKRAVRELGVKREWAVVAPNPTVQCEACAGRVELLDNGKPPILCTFCHHPLDKERAMAEGLWTPPEPRTPPVPPVPKKKE